MIADIVQEKRCTWCGVAKPFSDFSPGKRQKDGKHSHCKPCCAKRRKELRNGSSAATKRIKGGGGLLKKCRLCNLWKLKSEFYQSNSSGGYQSDCRKCCMGSRKSYYKANKETILPAERAKRWELRKEAIDAYGGKCVCCGESHKEFLTIDHIEGGGCEHRRSLGGTRAMFKMLRKEGWPRDKYRLLCYNCNCSRGAMGYCPHEEHKGRL